VLSHTLHYGWGAFEGARLPTGQGTAIFRLKNTPNACSTTRKICA
jgi:branched-subunit amino acid aminotransferase/4-amino-4-deoxychorismate lyase